MPPASRLPAAALAVLLVAALAALPLGPALAAPSPSILGAEFAAVDVDGNGLFDYLNITVVLSPPQNGSYLITVTLRWPTTGTQVATASAQASLSTGAPRITLRLEGAAVNEKQLNGPYNLTVDLVSSPSGPVHETASFATPPYRADDFERAPVGGKPRLEVGQEEVRLSSPGLNASVNLARPAVRWATAPGAPVALTYEASFPRVVAFADSGDGAFEGPELSCAADLTRANWSIVALDVGPSSDLGATVRFTLEGAVAFEGRGCSAPVGGRAAFSFLIAERNGTAGGALPFPLEGGLEVEVGLGLQLDAPLPGSALAFEVDLRDVASNASFLVAGPSGFERLDPSQGDLALAPLVPAVPSDIERVSFVDAGGAPRGHFSWLSLASENLSGGQERFTQVAASRGLLNGTLQLYLAAPNDPSVAGLNLDPAVGLSPQATAPHGGGPPPEVPVEGPSLVVFLGALAAVSAMFFFSVYARAKKE